MVVSPPLRSLVAEGEAAQCAYGDRAAGFCGSGTYTTLSRPWATRSCRQWLLADEEVSALGRRVLVGESALVGEVVGDEEGDGGVEVHSQAS